MGYWSLQLVWLNYFCFSLILLVFGSLLLGEYFLIIIIFFWWNYLIIKISFFFSTIIILNTILSSIIKTIPAIFFYCLHVVYIFCLLLQAGMSLNLKCMFCSQHIIRLFKKSILPIFDFWLNLFIFIWLDLFVFNVFTDKVGFMSVILLCFLHVLFLFLYLFPLLYK